ncbi:MAG TPA: hypothetical protein EYQ69_09815 [Gemmatimonadetes bacterium]|nr:hypothetical protein [Gemmatimonadota bacterium]
MVSKEGKAFAMTILESFRSVWEGLLNLLPSMVGAIVVLFLFVIMLLNLGHDYKKDIRGGLAVLLGFGVTGSIGGLLANQLGISDDAWIRFSDVGSEIDMEVAGKGITGVIAEPLFTEYVVAFEFTGILLFVAIVGAVALAKKAD